MFFGRATGCDDFFYATSGSTCVAYEYDRGLYLCGNVVKVSAYRSTTVVDDYGEGVLIRVIRVAGCYFGYS